MVYLALLTTSPPDCFLARESTNTAEPTVVSPAAEPAPEPEPEPEAEAEVEAAAVEGEAAAVTAPRQPAPGDDDEEEDDAVLDDAEASRNRVMKVRCARGALV